MQTANDKYAQIILAARNFCSFLESTALLAAEKFLITVQAQLLELFILGRSLPSAEAADKDFEDHLKENDYKKVLEKIAGHCPFQYYMIVLDPFDFNASQEFGMGDIVDDLGDIYRDLKRALLLFDSGSAYEQLDALWQIKFSFDHHWSAHCIDGIKAIYDYLNRGSE